MNHKPLPIGTDDFKKLISEGYYYIDKTLFIKELVTVQNPLGFNDQLLCKTEN